MLQQVTVPGYLTKTFLALGDIDPEESYRQLFDGSRRPILIQNYIYARLW